MEWMWRNEFEEIFQIHNKKDLVPEWHQILSLAIWKNDGTIDGINWRKRECKKAEQNTFKGKMIILTGEPWKKAPDYKLTRSIPHVVFLHETPKFPHV